MQQLTFYLAIIFILANNKINAFTTIKTEFLDCLTEDDLSIKPQNENVRIKNELDCQTINIQLSNCTCTTDYIDCSDKNFHSIPSDLTKMPTSITRLLFARNQIKSLKELSLNDGHKMSVINLKRNKISVIDQNFFSDQLGNDLDYLNLCGNINLNDFNNVDVNFTKLNWLELNHVIEPFEIMDSFFSKEKFPSLIILNLNHANLKLKKHPFDRLDKVELLRLDSNKLTQLPCESLREMQSLTSLNLNNNLLSQKPDVSQDCLNNCFELQQIFLGQNDLRAEDLEWMNLGQFKKLTLLDLSENKFEKIPYSALSGVKSMKSLKISIKEDNFTSPSNVESEIWPSLTYLELTNSNIKKIKNRSFELISEHLTELILKNCHIEEIEPDAFGQLNSLIFLDLSQNELKSLYKPSSLALFNYDLLRGNVNLTCNNFDCSKEIEWFINFYDYGLFDKNSIKCYLINGTKVPVNDYIISTNRTPTIQPKKTSKYNMLLIVLLVLILLVVAMGAFYFVKRKQMKQRQQQYRYRYFTERSQDDGFDTDNVPVYRDCTVSLRIKDTDTNQDTNNIINSNADTSAVLTEQPEIFS